MDDINESSQKTATPVSIRVLDLDGKRGSEAADSLRRFARQHGLVADIWSVGCMLEIARWGLTNATPALAVDGHIVCSGGQLSEGMLERCVLALVKMRKNANGDSAPV